LVSQAPCLYDIDLKGMNRLFMCSGNFSYTNVGVLRKPPKKFFDKLQTYINTSIVNTGYIESLIMWADRISIPDIYTITLSFKSLLPNNFNNFMYHYIYADTYDIISGDGLLDSSVG
jgi:hypothetical protein